MLNKSFKDTMHGINDKLRQWVPVRKPPEFWIAHPIFLEEFFALSRCGCISPLLCILTKHCLVPRHPGIIINSAVLRFVVAVANTAKENDCQHRWTLPGVERQEDHKQPGRWHFVWCIHWDSFLFLKTGRPGPRRPGHRSGDVYSGWDSQAKAVSDLGLYRQGTCFQACTWCPAVSWDKPLKWFPTTWLYRILSMSLYY